MKYKNQVNLLCKASLERSMHVVGKRIEFKDFFSDFYVNPDSVTLGDSIGKGQFGNVYKGEWRGTQVAVKVITLPPEMVNMKCENIKELKICR